MKCLKPFNRHYGDRISQWPCYSKCLPCLINRARIWTHRLLLESCFHENSSFITLTYNDSNLPSDGLLRPEHTQLFLKKLRNRIYPQKIRYYLVGEYGDKTLRPHYHAIIYGLNQYIAGGSDCLMVNGKEGIIRETWTLGGSVIGDVNINSISYVAGYVTKKLKEKKLDGEFQRMSLRPGLGAGISESVGFQLSNFRDKTVLPSTLRTNGSLLPLGRYLRGKIADATASKLKGDTLTEDPRLQLQRLQQLREDYKAIAMVQKTSVQKIMIDMGKQKLNNIEARYRIFSPQGVL